MGSSTICTSLLVKRKSIRFLSDQTRVISRAFWPGHPSQIVGVFDCIAGLTDDAASKLLERTVAQFAGRHRDIEGVFLDHYNGAVDQLSDVMPMARVKKLLIGSYFTMEYSIESAGLFNPSIMFAPDQESLPAGHARVILSFRATGEGHVSSLQFRGGVITDSNELTIDAVSPYVNTPSVARTMYYDKSFFGLQLLEMGMPQALEQPSLGPFLQSNEVLSALLNRLGQTFTLEDLHKAMTELRADGLFDQTDVEGTFERAEWLACSNYEVRFDSETSVSERILFPASENEQGGIEDARFVRFVDGDEVTYYATYTAFDRETTRPQLLETTDFLSFRVSTLNGEYARSKGVALFPRKINGKYAMISRVKGQQMCILSSDDIRFWHGAQTIGYSLEPWEFVQVGNCGSPVETDAGWLVITHGVGAMRRYCLGAMLLDRDDPTKVLGKLAQPLLAPDETERNGHVPNVVYTCGAIVHNDELIIPYAMADRASSIATVSLPELLEVLLKK